MALSWPSDVQRTGGLPEPATHGGSAAQLGRLTREDEALIRDFLNRRHTLSPRRCDDLARQIAAVVHGHIGGAFPLHGAPELPAGGDFPLHVPPGLPAERYLALLLAAAAAPGLARR